MKLPSSFLDQSKGSQNKSQSSHQSIFRNTVTLQTYIQQCPTFPVYFCQQSPVSSLCGFSFCLFACFHMFCTSSLFLVGNHYNIPEVCLGTVGVSRRPQRFCEHSGYNVQCKELYGVGDTNSVTVNHNIRYNLE